MIRRPPRSTRVRSSAASDVYKRQDRIGETEKRNEPPCGLGDGRGQMAVPRLLLVHMPPSMAYAGARPATDSATNLEEGTTHGHFLGRSRRGIAPSHARDREALFVLVPDPGLSLIH